jgi:membrane-associated HD superfamily phosphohydrolase
MTDDNLEKKVQNEITKDIVKNFSYFSAAYNRLELGKDKNAAEYVKIALNKIIDNVGSETRQYIDWMPGDIEKDLEVNGTLTNKTIGPIQTLAGLYETKICKANLSEIVSAAKDMGYNEKIPEFLDAYMDKSLNSLVEGNPGKFKKTENGLEIKDEKLGLVYDAYKLLVSIMPRKADEFIMDTMIKQHLEAMNKHYKAIEEQEKAKANQAKTQ